MGTNYYLSKVGEGMHCPTCTCHSQGLHIGKSSAGWCFSLHVIPEKGLNSLEGWKREFEKPGIVIRDEYDNPTSVASLLDTITNRSWVALFPNSIYESEEHFNRQNHAVAGPHGLSRHIIDQYCIEHGDGTWDLMLGDFS